MKLRTQKLKLKVFGLFYFNILALALAYGYSKSGGETSGLVDYLFYVIVIGGSLYVSINTYLQTAFSPSSIIIHDDYISLCFSRADEIKLEWKEVLEIVKKREWFEGECILFSYRFPKDKWISQRVFVIPLSNDGEVIKEFWNIAKSAKKWGNVSKNKLGVSD